MFRSNKLIRTAVIIILGTLVLDIFTKWLIHVYLVPYESVTIIDNFAYLVYAKNLGSAFSFLHDAPVWFRKPFFLTIPLVAMIFIGYVMHKSKENKVQFLSFAVVLAGALGNFINRIYPGYVIDFMDIKITNTYHWPSFNVADIAISVGVIMVMLDMLKQETKKNKKPNKK